ncbi:hypothetical protein MBLNU459_g2067t1 [Dothideomycetes sp. NU459]
MQYPILLALAASFSALVTASPVVSRAINGSNPFYLVTTNQHASAAHSSSLKNVSLTTLFSPYYQPNYLLRLIAPGYEYVPTFNLTDGVLHSVNNGPHGIGTYIFNSTEVVSGSELQFRAEYEGHGDLSLKDGYLLAVNGTAKGWTICVEELGQSVLEWKGTDATCTPTYLQAVLTPPY